MLNFFVFLFQSGDVYGEKTLSLFDVIWNGEGKWMIIALAVIIILLFVLLLTIIKKARSKPNKKD